MSKSIGYHTFTNSPSGTTVLVDVELHEDIDYDFFDNDTKDNSVVVAEDTQKERKSNLKVNKACYKENLNDSKIADSKETPINEITNSTVRFSGVTKSEDGKQCVGKESVSSKQEKKAKLKDLMNCIAYGENKRKENDEDEEEEKEDYDKINSPSPDFLSLSTDTTSEITSVTTRPSSSGCSSMAKCESEECLLDKKETDLINNLQNKQKNYNIGNSSMKLLLDALESFEKHEVKSATSSILSSGSRQKGRRNMSFSNEQLRKIDRENEILIRKLEKLRKSRPKPQPPVPVNLPRLSSSAINRKRQQRKIDNDNKILLKKIETAKPSASIALSTLRR